MAVTNRTRLRIREFVRACFLEGRPEGQKFAGRAASLLLSACLAVGSVGCTGQAQQAQELVRTAAKQQSAGQNEDAIRTLTRSLSLNPDLAEAYYLRGTCHVAMAELSEAIADLEKAREKNPGWDRAWWALGTAYRSVGRRDDALLALNEACELNPEAADSRYDRACLLLEMGQRSEAVGDLQAATQLDPSNAAAQLRYGTLLTETDPQRAVDVLSSAIQLDRKNATAWVQRGLAHERSGAGERALADLSVACRMKPDDAEAWMHRGRLLNQLSRHAEAIEDLTRAAQLAPQNAIVQQQLQLAQSSLKKSPAMVASLSSNVPDEHRSKAPEPNLAAQPTLRLPEFKAAPPAVAASEPEVQPGPVVADGFDLFPADGRVPEPEPKTGRVTQAPVDGFALFPGDESQQMTSQQDGNHHSAPALPLSETAAIPAPIEVQVADNPFAQPGGRADC
ncbi:MAG: tetratricopeptide repeat protein [Planctomycetaceae bacterium]